MLETFKLKQNETKFEHPHVMLLEGLMIGIGIMSEDGQVRYGLAKERKWEQGQHFNFGLCV